MALIFPLRQFVPCLYWGKGNFLCFPILFIGKVLYFLKFFQDLLWQL